MNLQAENRGQKVKTIFLEAIEKMAGTERISYLDEACGSDARLRCEVESLLLAHQRAGEFLDPAAFSSGIGSDRSPLTEGPGTVIGRYKLLEKIGEGGMAVVYMAEQEQPIRRRVALKIIKLGMDTRQVIARFEAERQVLAMMDHPNIAKVLDAGATETGRPYFVMELVQGVSITEYCDKNNLCTKDRLALFVLVCNAVQHAHQKGIIHRDIKPSNVMVTHHDGRPMPKVIDFGIAKAMNQRLTEKTLFTRYAHIIGTPAYMSPEQAELSDVDVDTRSDIYSLGVLLYELLTGTTPFSEEELRKAGYIEMQRVIREQEPIKPSTKLSTLSDTLTDIAKHRGCTLDLLRKAVRGDLDWIVMKSLEKDRARRYETASGLAEDIRRHLESEPVLARSPGTLYCLHKFLRRNRSRVIAAFAIAVAVGAGGIFLLMWNRDRGRLLEAEGFKHRNILSQAREQYARAEREAASETIQPILGSKYVGPEALLLRAGILVDNRRFDEATTVLKDLLDGRAEIAAAAHALLARILWESASLDAEKLRQIEEHRRKAEALLPETAEAYFLRAMTAITVNEQLIALDEALRLNPKHYESLRLRACTWYASRKYERMNEDAYVMETLRDSDPLGHSLRATALQELGRCKEAVAKYDRAIELAAKDSLQRMELSVQRYDTLLRMGDYQRIIAELLAGAKDVSPLQNQLFGALTAVGDYDEASALFRRIISPGLEARTQFRNWCAQYVFDTLAAGRFWHPPGPVPTGAAFLPMVEAEETYRVLAAKGHRLTGDGFGAVWSPDGKKLAFSLGVRSRSGIAVFDPATKETDLLIVPGKYPKWSPDGRHIAFVRDRQFLPVPEFVAADPKNEPPPSTEEEVWLMRSDGTSPRRLAGVWPSWGRDSNCIYYKSRPDDTLYSISIAGGDPQPERVTPCRGSNPSVSSDNQLMAFIEDASLKVKDLASQTVSGKRPLPVPSNGWGASAWSPSGAELCLGGSGEMENRTGLWIYRLDRAEPAKVLDGPITVGAWSPDGTRLVFELGAPHLEIWTADLDPSVSTVEALGPARTVEDHLRDVVAFHTRRIAADPLDASAYSRRAQCYDCLHDQARASADMRRWSAAASGRLPGDFRRVIDVPLNCELVFSTERPVHNMSVMSVAFGQKGRCGMKLFEVPRVVTSLVGLCFLTGLDAPPARADFTFGAPADLEAAMLFFPTSDCFVSCFSSDGLEMFVESNLAGGQGGARDIWVLKRASPEDDWGPPENLGPAVNSASTEFCSSISGDGLELYFHSDRPGGYGTLDLYVTRRATRTSPWGPATNLGPKVNTSYLDYSPSVSSDGLELYFASWCPGGNGAGDLYVTRRTTVNEPWGDPVNLGSAVNSPYVEECPCLSADGLLLVFQGDRRGGFGGVVDLWMTRRSSHVAPWEPAVNLGPTINSPEYDCRPCLAPDGSALYFEWNWPDRRARSWKAPIVPIVDFNGDGKVDLADMTLFESNIGKGNLLYDVGPFPWGDGVVDEKDLAVLMQAMMTPGPQASGVSPSVGLSWFTPSFAESFDVYLGTSRDAVTMADRSDPCGVLISQGQMGTTYDPNGLLEYGRTYYWRVDLVISGAAPTIYKGLVLSYTTRPYGCPIKPIKATASSQMGIMTPTMTVDGSGLNANDEHSFSSMDMWLSSKTGPQPAWIQYEFDAVYPLHQMWVWNQNQIQEPDIGLGAKDVTIETSLDGTTWTALADVPEFAQAPGEPNYVHNTTVDFGGVETKYIRLTIHTNWAGTNKQTGLSEVRFFYILEKSTAQP